VNAGHIQLTTWMATPSQLSANDHLIPPYAGRLLHPQPEYTKKRKKQLMNYEVP